MSFSSTSLPLQVQGLTKKFKDFKAVDNISFQIKKGQVFGLLGPNGAGKTTAISMLVGLHLPTSGDINIFGHSALKTPYKTKPLVGYVPQELISYSFFNVKQILEFSSGYYGLLKNGKKIEELLKTLELWDDRKKLVKNLSGGMKRRLLIAKALAHNPPLLFLDEPTAGVDIELRENLWRLVRGLKKQNISVLLTTHYLEEAEQLCDEVAVMHKGCIREQDTTNQIISKFSFRKIKIILKQGVIPKNKNHEWILSDEPPFLTLKLPYYSTLSIALEKVGISFSGVEEIFTEEGSLEEAFKKIINYEQT